MNGSDAMAGTGTPVDGTITEALNTMRKRLLFRSWHRGTKETDQVLGGFADRYLNEFTPAQLATYDRVLDLEDHDLWDWLTGRDTPPAAVDSDVMRLLLAFRLQD
jgi:antitoxin CptB